MSLSNSERAVQKAFVERGPVTACKTPWCLGAHVPYVSSEFSEVWDRFFCGKSSSIRLNTCAIS